MTGNKLFDNGEKIIVDSKGKEALTYFEKIKSNGNMSLLKATLETGRKHQIRVQCASLNHPILNDSLYGGKRIDNTGLLLQSHHIQFNDS